MILARINIIIMHHSCSSGPYLSLLRGWPGGQHLSPFLTVVCIFLLHPPSSQILFHHIYPSLWWSSSFPLPGCWQVSYSSQVMFWLSPLYMAEPPQSGISQFSSILSTPAWSETPCAHLNILISVLQRSLSLLFFKGQVSAP